MGNRHEGTKARRHEGKEHGQVARATGEEHGQDGRATDPTGAIDRIGAINVLVGLKEQLVDQAKAAALEMGAKHLEGAEYVGCVSGGGGGSAIDPLAFLAICKRKGVAPPAIAAAITVSKNAEKLPFLSPDEIRSISVETGTNPVRLVVTRKKELAAMSVAAALAKLAEH